MSLVAAAIMPHRWNLIPELDPTAAGATATVDAMRTVGAAFRERDVEVIVLAGPHGFRVANQMLLLDVARLAGSLTLDGMTVELNVPVDRPLTHDIARHASSKSIPVALGGYAGNRADQAVAPMDWGFFVPLWFLDNGHAHEQGVGDVLSPPPSFESVPSIAAITPARGLPRQSQIEFGRAIAEAIEADSRRIAFVASCDWSHVHHESGPYGFDPIATSMDQRIITAIESDTLASLADLPQDEVDRAAIDGLWQTLILAGLRERSQLPDVRMLSYEVPSYYSMIVTLYQ